MYESLFSPFSELERLQRELQQVFGGLGRPGNIRAVASGAFPPINVGGTPSTIDVYAFAPGLDPDKLDIQIHQGLLSIAGERANARPEERESLVAYTNERFSGRFKRTLGLADDADPDNVEARYSNGVLHIRIGRRESAQPRRITIQ